LLQDFKNARTAFDRIIEVKDEVWCVFQDDVLCERGLKDDAILCELRHCGGLAILPKNADVSMRVFQVRCDIHLIHRHEHTVESNFASNNCAQLAFQEFVDAE
jgi:hypothetical protein